ncbi:MarR family winged helix-turn-helix transcriptional regulator [Chryseolinea soli]|uniref:MarR family transcriptional regulator n=1 Tax=Chryseolinea soli TaxID=2321403 RepID=A0A385SVD7_9BACT|nr:MarR family transcriptional regulator [Chryseolinea soli]AYB34506.1 MarR family transcriptional regulator [Chryseolinea soli]
MKIEDEIKQKKFINAHQKAVINLVYTTNWMQGKHQEVFKSFNITPQQFNILRILKGQHPNSTSATEIKARMLDRNSDVSRLLDRLVAKNVIVKKACPTDKRAFDVNLTEAGLELLRTLDKKQSELDNILNLSEEEAYQLSDLLDKSRG